MRGRVPIRVVIAAVAAGVAAAGLWLVSRPSAGRDAAHVREPEAPVAAEPAMRQPPMTRDRYEGSDLGFPAAFDIPSGWKLEHERGTIDPYAQIRLLGPRNADDTFRAMLAVRAYPRESGPPQHDSAGAWLAHLKAHLPPGAMIERELTRDVAGRPATDLTAAYVIPPLHRPGLPAVEIPVRMRTIVTQTGGHVVEVMGSSDAREFEWLAPRLDALLRSLELAEPDGIRSR
ncbi:MAG TPA: hypothetical protein VGB20_01265 [bacterium]